jgi:hypothetical protein
MIDHGGLISLFALSSIDGSRRLRGLSRWKVGATGRVTALDWSVQVARVDPLSVLARSWAGGSGPLNLASEPPAHLPHLDMSSIVTTS